MNLPTNFLDHHNGADVQTVQLFGHGVGTQATPVEHPGTSATGTSQSGPDPGAEYPDLRVTHAYVGGRGDVSPSLDVTYQGR